MNSFLAVLVARQMEDLGHDVLRAEPEGNLWKDYYQKYELYGCKRCGYIFGVDKTQCIFIVGSVSNALAKGQTNSFDPMSIDPMSIRKYGEQDETLMCEDLIVKGIIE